MAGRQQKPRPVGTIPEYVTFQPDGISNGEEVILKVDEFETIRLIDFERLNQSATAEKMKVARTTVTAIYERARTKLADVIINGKQLKIIGGNVHYQPQNVKTNKNIKSKGEATMRIAATYDNGEIFQHFGRTEQFKIYDVEYGKITSSQVIDTNGAGHGALANFLKENNVDTIISGGIGGGAQAALNEAGISIYGGVSDSTDEAAQKLIDGSLEYDPSVVCSHHEGHHEDEGCGHHEHHGHGGCGNHGCHN